MKHARADVENFGRVSDSGAMTEKLAKDVDAIIDYIAIWAAGYSTGLKWNEVAKLKADMMNMPHRWRSVTTEALRAKCLSAGLSAKDTETVVSLCKNDRLDSDLSLWEVTAPSVSRKNRQVNLRRRPITYLPVGIGDQNGLDKTMRDVWSRGQHCSAAARASALPSTGRAAQHGDNYA